ncbi:MAG: DUF2922 domain-containing protein [Defluviitaleaceae bacterium]|nr:DUF2922 domain-containing protein [Defluviitaleaceae bacterium]
MNAYLVLSFGTNLGKTKTLRVPDAKSALNASIVGIMMSNIRTAAVFDKATEGLTSNKKAERFEQTKKSFALN